jgi:hypothetical protein
LERKLGPVIEYVGNMATRVSNDVSSTPASVYCELSSDMLMLSTWPSATNLPGLEKIGVAVEALNVDDYILVLRATDSLLILFIDR